MDASSGAAAAAPPAARERRSRAGQKNSTVKSPGASSKGSPTCGPSDLNVGRWEKPPGKAGTLPEADEMTQLLWKPGYNVENPFEFDDLGAYLGKFPRGCSWGYWPLETNANWLENCKPVTIAMMRRVMQQVQCPTDGLKDVADYARRMLNLLDFQYKLIPREEEVEAIPEPVDEDAARQAAERQAMLALQCANLTSDIEVMRATLASMKEDVHRYTARVGDILTASEPHMRSQIEKTIYTGLGLPMPNAFTPVSSVAAEPFLDDAPADPTEQRLSLLTSACFMLLDAMEPLQAIEGVHIAAPFKMDTARKELEDRAELLGEDVPSMFARAEELLTAAVKGPRVALPASPISSPVSAPEDDPTSPMSGASKSSKKPAGKKKKKKGKRQEAEEEEKVRMAWDTMRETLREDPLGLVGGELPHDDPAHYRLAQRLMTVAGRVAALVDGVWRADQDRLINDAANEGEKMRVEQELDEARQLLAEQAEAMAVGMDAPPPPEKLPESIQHVETFIAEKRKTLPELPQEDSETVRSLLVKIQEMQGVIDSFLEACPAEKLGEPPPEAPPDSFLPSSRKHSRNVRLMSACESLLLPYEPPEPSLKTKSMDWRTSYSSAVPEGDLDADIPMRPVVPVEDRATQTPGAIRDAAFDNIFRHRDGEADSASVGPRSKTERMRETQKSRWLKVLELSGSMDHTFSPTTPAASTPLDSSFFEGRPKRLSPVARAVTMALTPLDKSFDLSNNANAVQASPSFTRQQANNVARPWRPAGGQALTTPQGKRYSYEARKEQQQQQQQRSSLSVGFGLNASGTTWRTPSARSPRPSPMASPTAAGRRGQHAAAPSMWSSSAAAAAPSPVGGGHRGIGVSAQRQSPVRFTTPPRGGGSR